HCLAYPSSYEGFGIPVLEAQRAGCPVIALKSSSIPEVMGNTWGMMDRLDESEFKWMLSRLHDTSLRNQTITDGLENSKRFSWEKMANDYICLYNRLLNIAR
ncbi:glycosyltransferase, partial [uncultured Duncaniella sp.]